MYILFGFMMVFLLSNVLALLNVMVIGFLNKIIKKINLKIILIPLSLTLVAIIKEFLLGGFPWNPSSVIWVNNLYILKIIQLMGIYGVGVITHLIIALVLYALINKNKIIIVLSTILVCGFFGLQFLPINITNDKALNENSDFLSVLIVQPNIKDSLVNNSSIEHLEIYEKITREALKDFPKSDLIIWPEGSLSLDLNNKKILLKRIGNLLSGQQKIILGANAIEEKKLFNRMYLIDSSGNVEQYYDKRKLVLFGEYIPFKASKISKFLNRGLSFSKGERDNNIYLPKNSLLRSVEQKMILVRSTPSGISSVVNFNGEIMQKIDSNQSGFINYNIFKSPIVKECKPFLKITIILLLLFYFFGIIYDRIRR